MSSFRDAPDRGPDAAATEVCLTYSILQMCEQAHWDVTGKRLCLNEWDARSKSPEVKAHIQTCGVCRGWYANARRAYERLQAAADVSDLKCPLPAPAPWRTPRLCPVGKPRRKVVQVLAATDGPNPLDRLAFRLDWAPDPDGGWWLTLTQVVHEGDATAAAREAEFLRQLSGRSILVECRQVKNSDVPPLLTRLDFDGDQRFLVSTPGKLVVDHPKTCFDIALTALDIDGTDGA